MRLALLAFSLFVSAQAFAFRTTSHYFVSTEPSALGLNQASHWDAEASSDLITYQRPLAWENAWWRDQKSFDLTLGSLSGKQFLDYQRVKIHHELTPGLEFRFNWLEERDFEQDFAAAAIELKLNLTERWAISVFGMPSLYKSEDDLGFSVFFKPSRDWELRASGLWGDYDRNKRSLQSDEWSEPPVSWTASALYLPEEREKDFAYFEIHHEPRSERRDLGALLWDMAYDSAMLTGSRALSDGRSFGYRLLWDRAHYTEGATGEVRTRRRAMNQFEYGFYLGPHVVRPGINLMYREEDLGSEFAISREVLPTVWFDLPARTKSFGVAHWSLGYDATVFDRQVGSSHDHNLEHRLNVKWNLRFKTAGELALLFTFDLDRFGSGETWEGGAGQFRLVF